MINVFEQIQNAHRRIEAGWHAQGEVRSVIVSRLYSGNVSEVWDACTNPERIQRWFLPITGDLAVGGRYQLEGNAGGVIDRCEPPTCFSATWEFGGEISWIELRLAPTSATATLFELTHTVPVNDKWQHYGPGAVGPGWDLALVELYAHLLSFAGGPGLQSDWTESSEGHESIRLSCEGWYRAHVAAGADLDEARAAADRTTAFWCTPSPSSVNHVGK